MLGIFLAAVVTAAVLRHVVHVYGGFSREDIRIIALIAAGVGLLAIIYVRTRKRQSKDGL
jgi:hypothetical protein